MKLRVVIAVTLFLVNFSASAWNAAGHQLVAQIAFAQLSEPVKAKIAILIGRKGSPLKPETLLRASIWMDAPSQRLNAHLRVLHYIDWPFSLDASVLPPVQGNNALTGLQKAVILLKNPYTPFREKQKQLKILLHVVGDIHQPLHAATKISKRYPEGDKGGNLTPIYATRISHNLHGFWDKGGASLLAPKKGQQLWVKTISSKLAKQYPCHVTIIDFKAWAIESHMLAMTNSYGQLAPDAEINQSYQDNTALLSEQQIALAGCRLAATLDSLFKVL